MEGLLSVLSGGHVLVADGAMGTMLQQKGLSAGVPPEVWVLENPAAVSEVHTAYVEAGADLILTCTFGANRVRLSRSGNAGRVAEINRRAVEIARSAAGERAYVAGDIGPLGEFLAPIGPLSYQDAMEIFAEQMVALVEAGVDVLYIETMSALEEMIAAVEAARQVGDGIPIFATFSFDHHGRTNTGVRPEQAAQELSARDVQAFGANCGATLEMTLEAVQRMHAVVPQAWLIAKPNAGLPRRVGAQTVYDASPEDMAAYVGPFLAAGVRVIGGCCGSTPAHIAAVSAVVRRTGGGEQG